MGPRHENYIQKKPLEMRTEDKNIRLRTEDKNGPFTTQINLELQPGFHF